MLGHYTLADATHLIQVALTPVFLLSGIGALLNVFAGRLARVADQLAALNAAIRSGGAAAEQNEQLGLLRRRSLILDVAVVLATGGAAATCLAIMTLFLFALSNKAIASVLLLFFGLAVLCTLGSVLAFGVEMVLRDRLRMVVAARGEVIQARDVDPREPWPYGRDRPQDEAVSD
jgi:hypothetical protein